MLLRGERSNGGHECADEIKGAPRGQKVVSKGRPCLSRVQVRATQRKQEENHQGGGGGGGGRGGGGGGGGGGLKQGGWGGGGVGGGGGGCNLVGTRGSGVHGEQTDDGRGLISNRTGQHEKTEYFG